MKSLFSTEHESIHFYSNPEVGLEAIVAIHSTIKGVALGGCRIKEFPSKEMALEEVLRLSRHMSYKALLFDLEIGGAKSVILAKKDFKKTPQLLSAFARSIDSLGGQYIVSVDMGSDSEDMQYIRGITPHVVGYDEEKGGGGDPGLFTSEGVLKGIETAAQHRWSSPSLEGKKILILGLGDVGFPLAQKLAKRGAELIVCELDTEKIQKLRQFVPSFKVIDFKEIHTQKCDIFSPCAGGGILSKETASALNCEVVAGAANNQLQEEEAGKILHERGIVYVPDFAINSGGLIGVVMYGVRKISKEKTLKKIDQIADVVQSILEESKSKNKPSEKVALEMARKKYQIQVSKTKIDRGSF